MRPLLACVVIALVASCATRETYDQRYRYPAKVTEQDILAAMQNHNLSSEIESCVLEEAKENAKRSRSYRIHAIASMKAQGGIAVPPDSLTIRDANTGLIRPSTKDEERAVEAERALSFAISKCSETE